MSETFITYEELKNIAVLMNFLNEYHDMDSWHINVETKVYDHNGDELGGITVFGSEFVFYPKGYQ